MDDGIAPVTFPVIIYKIQTLVDGGTRYTFDSPTDALVIAQLAEYYRLGVSGNLTFVPIKNGPELGYGEKQHDDQAGRGAQPQGAAAEATRLDRDFRTRWESDA